MAKLIKSIQKVDDYTVRITLNKPEAPFLSNLAMEYAGVQSKEYADAMLKAGTPEKIDQEPSAPAVLSRAIPEGRVVRYKAFPEFWGGKAKIDDLVFAITPDASVRWAKLQKGECHVMPYPTGRPRRDPQGPERRRARSAGLERRLPRLQHNQEAVRRRARAQGDQHGHRQEGDHRRRVPDHRRRGEEPDSADAVVVQRQHQGRPVRSGRGEEAPRRSGYPNGFTTDLWAMPVQRPYNPNAKRIAELMQADLAKSA
jgi:dipeptide transport system substrate-binding protein